MGNKKRDFLCWLAGFYEGEGSCGFYQKMDNGKGILHFSISQNEREPLQMIRDFLGYGSISKTNGCHCYSTRGHFVIETLELLMPFMKTERKINQAINAVVAYLKKPPEDRKKYNNKSIVSLLRKRDKHGRYI